MKTHLQITNQQNTSRIKKITFLFAILFLVFINNVVGQKYTYYYTKSSFSSNANVKTMDTADIDNDGQIEILIGAYDRIDIEGSVNLSLNTYLDSVDYDNYSAFGDIDGDGDVDFVNANDAYYISSQTPLSWYENNASSFTKHYFGSNIRCRVVCIANILNGNKDNIVIGIGSTISWLSINSDTNFSEHIVTTSAVSIKAIKAADINGDGRVDIVSSQGSTVVWYKNIDGQGNFGPAQTIANNTNGLVGPVLGRKAMDLADVDNDGDIDVLVNGILRVFLNNGTGVFTDSIIDNTNSHSISFGDINGDGLFDIVSCNYDMNHYWYKNNGNGSFIKEVMFNNENPRYTAVIDFGGDNKGEVFVNHYKYTAHDCNVAPTGNIIGNPNPATYTTLTYIVPNTANSTYEWGVVGGAITTNNGNSIDVLWGADGAGSMYVQETDAHGCMADTVWLSIYVDIDEISPESSISVYPNPTTGIIQIMNAKNSIVEIIDVTGKLIQKIVITNEEQIIDLSQEEKGVYFIKVITNNGTLTKKLIVK